ncbi:sigma 54-interacting transcriptional regulator [Neisseria gonorrhoeae]
MVISNPRELEKLKDRIPNLINIIRVAIVFPLMIMHILGLETGSRANLHASWTAWAFYLWLAIACWMIFFSTLNPQWQWQALRIPSFSAVADITMIGVLTYLFGGIDSGFGILILPFVGSSCLLSYGRYPLLYASYASILLIFNALADSNINMYPLILDAKTVTNTFVVVAGSYFVAMIASLSVRYIDRAGKLAHENHVAYRRIRGLNQIVLNRVQEAVVVINVEHQTILFNKKAKDLLPMLEIGQHTSLFDPVAILWDKTSSRTFEHYIDTPELTARIRAVPMNKKQNKLLILYIRPQSEIQAEALSVKLAALGQLTANLAHEIRNPMSAIRHADGGTLFLDEVADLPLSMQVKLLRAIQEKAVRRIGDATEQPVDVRIVCATHKNLEALVESGAFRQDLYYRLNVVSLNMPSLREMRENLKLPTPYLLYKHSHNNRPYTLSPAAQQMLLNYSYPGNFRELENILERAVALCVGYTVQIDDLQIQDVHHKPVRTETAVPVADTLPSETAAAPSPAFSRSTPIPCRYRTISTKSNATSSDKSSNKPKATARKPPNAWASASALCATVWNAST